MNREHCADRRLEAAEQKQSQVVVGLDPRISELPEQLLQEAVEEHGRTAAAAASAILRFNRDVLDAVCGAAVAVKPQIAFYERFGCEGLRAYAQTIREAHTRGLLVIADVKRNDIGSTAEAYAEAHLSGPAAGNWQGAGEFRADALTVNPLFGSDGVRPFLKRAERSGCGVFALVRTSNPSSKEIQDLPCGGRPLYERIGALVEQWGRPYVGSSRYSLLGAVAGATFPEELAALRRIMPHSLFLIPGFGAQGGGVRDVLGAFDRHGRGAVVSSSRDIIYAFRRGPYAEEFGLERWQEAVRSAAERMRQQIWRATHGGGADQGRNSSMSA